VASESLALIFLFSRINIHLITQANKAQTSAIPALVPIGNA
jgi:hypothetical protein